MAMIVLLVSSPPSPALFIMAHGEGTVDVSHFLAAGGPDFGRRSHLEYLVLEVVDIIDFGAGLRFLK